MLRKNTILLALCFILLSGCHQGGDPQSLTGNLPTEAQKEFVLKSGTLRPLYNDQEISTLHFPVENNYVSLAASGFSLDLVFNGPLDFLSLDQGVTLAGTNQPYLVKKYEGTADQTDQIINITAPSLAPGNYQLSLNSQLRNAQGQTLSLPVLITIHLESRTQTEFFLVDSSGLPRPLSYEESSSGLSLSDSSKTFILHFDQEVRQDSVESSLLKGWESQPLKAAFSWISPQQLRLNLSQLQTGTNYQLQLNQALDNRGYPIMGTCRFRTGKPSDIGKIDLVKDQQQMLYQFTEERFSGLPDQSLSNRLILQTSNNRCWVFGLNTATLTPLPILHYDLSRPQKEKEPIWLDQERLLGYNHHTKELLMVSSISGDITPFYTLTQEPLECSLAPDQKTLAVVTAGKDQALDLWLLNMNKGKVTAYQKDFAQGYLTDEGQRTLNLTWDKDDSFLFSDKGNLKRAEVTPEGTLAEKPKTLLKNTHLLAALPNQDLLLCRQDQKEEAGLFLLQNHQTLKLPGLTIQSRDFYCLLLDATTILYQQNQQIYAYTIPEQTSRLLGSGLLLGGTAPEKAAYYMTNAEDFDQILAP